MQTVGKTIMHLNSGDVVSRSNSVSNEKEFPQNKLMIGFRSKDAKTWLNGPTHEIRNQCLPGYTGFIPGIKSENVFSTTYAQNTAASFDCSIPRGCEAPPAERFKTIGAEKFSPQNNRRILADDKQLSRRDYLEYTINTNNQHRKERDEFLEKDGGKHNTSVSPIRFKKDLNGSPYNHVKDMQVRPRILQSKLVDSPKFQNLSTGFQRVFTDQEVQDEKLRLPVVGYAGHTKGKKAENYYAKSFRETAMFAETNMRKQRKHSVV